MSGGDSMETTKVFVSLEGCDDATRFWMDVTDEERKFLRRLAGVVEEHSFGGCQPSLVVEWAEETA